MSRRQAHEFIKPKLNSRRCHLLVYSFKIFLLNLNFKIFEFGKVLLAAGRPINYTPVFTQNF